MRSSQILVHLLSAALLAQPLLAAPIFWFLPWSFPNFPTSTSSTSGSTSSSASSGASNSSNVSVAIGNRVNTSTGLDDYGTNITNVQINVNRQRRSVANTFLNLNDLGDGGGGDDAEADTGGSYISIGEHIIRLPANISNLTLNTYLINGLPVDESMAVPSEMGSAGETNLLVTTIRLFRNFLKSFLAPASG
ncbi:threonine/serine-rich mucin [Anopheles darlingi]|uniref:Threonine/serine-rich mucin n=1 Tax=Anopheles darlingi TaxID=43151 RepID=W5J5S4_ANODA|nr:threonine/serine-rich mucin [Anopheles darlingi]